MLQRIRAAVARWIRLRLPSFGPGFDPQAQNLCFFDLYLKYDEKIDNKKPRD